MTAAKIGYAREMRAREVERRAECGGE